MAPREGMERLHGVLSLGSYLPFIEPGEGINAHGSLYTKDRSVLE